MESTQNTGLRQIRMMTSLDLDAVVAIELQCSADPWPKNIFALCLDKYQAYVLVLNREVIGYAVIMLADVECQLLNIAIDPRYQHQGHGEYLLKDMIEAAQLERAEEIILEVRCSNIPAQQLYKKLGFKVIGHRKDYYLTTTGREDAEVMSLHL